MFDELVNNEFNVPVRVLGWGTKWNGYADKHKGMQKYLETKGDDEVVVFVDGFDTKINKNPSNLDELFKSFDCKVLLSKDPSFAGKWITEYIFGTCDGRDVANAGLYMGYAKYLKMFIQDTLRETCSDDQVNFNTVCKKHNFVKVDNGGIIFKNFSPRDLNKTSDAIFVSYPASPSLSRYSRAIGEYLQFLYIFIIAMLLVAMIVFPKYDIPMFIALMLYVAAYILVLDKTCTVKV
jgi:hypothetical protein